MDKNILVLAPHTDDGELGCGGSIVKLIEQGNSVHYAVFSCCEQAVPDGFPQDVLEKEMRDATAVLGIPAENLHIFAYPVRNLSSYRQEILDNMIGLKKFDFDMVFMPSLHDIHQDHITVANEGVRAFKQTTLLSYEMPWNNLTVDTTAFIELEEHHIDRKVEALMKYESQTGFRNYLTREFIEGLALVRGVQIGKRFAETFEVVRWVL